MLSTLLGLGVLVSIVYVGPNLAIASEKTPSYSKIVSRIAQKFNLKESDVEAVFSAVREEQVAELKERREARLAEAVKEGILSEEQKDALLIKIEETHKTKKGHNEMLKWFREQGIDHARLKQYLIPHHK